MYYEINISHEGDHYFATSDRSITNLSKATSIYFKLKEQYPESEGFHVTVTQWETVGRDVTKKFK